MLVISITTPGTGYGLAKGKFSFLWYCNRRVWALAVLGIRQVVTSRFWVIYQVGSAGIQVKAKVGRKQKFGPRKSRSRTHSLLY